LSARLGAAAGPRPDLVIFDCDGVLVDSEALANEILARALGAEGLAMDVAECRRRYVGLSMASVIAKVEAELGRALPDGWLDALQRETFAAFRDRLSAVPGVTQAVDAIRAAGLPVCVASSGSIEKMTLTLGLTGLAPRFEGRLFSASMVTRGKPFPDLFLHAAAAMGVVPARAVVVEDSIPGVRAARAAGMRALAYARDGDPAALAAEGGEPFMDMDDLPRLVGL
jgi:HAD superfamily hydrolase (TIGR01509 family)